MQYWYKLFVLNAFLHESKYSNMNLIQTTVYLISFFYKVNLELIWLRNVNLFFLRHDTLLYKIPEAQKSHIIVY